MFWTGTSLAVLGGATAGVLGTWGGYLYQRLDETAPEGADPESAAVVELRNDKAFARDNAAGIVIGAIAAGVVSVIGIGTAVAATLGE
jgi:hypothetical protein